MTQTGDEWKRREGDGEVWKRREGECEEWGVGGRRIRDIGQEEE